MANLNISNQILGAIDIAVDKALQQANFNKTVEGNILYCINPMTGKYRVSINGVETNAFALNNITYTINDKVYIQFQGGTNITDKYIIGKKSDAPVTSGIQSLSFDKRYHIGGEFEFKNNDDTNSSLYTIDLKKGESVSDYILEAFQTISCGLTFNLTVIPDNYDKIDEDNDKYTIELKRSDNTILTTLTMDALEGNPYSMSNQKQVFIFDNRDFIELNSIEVIAQGQFDGTFVDETNTTKNRVELSDIKFFVAQDLCDPTIKDYLIRKEEYGKLIQEENKETWVAFRWLTISNKWQKYQQKTSTEENQDIVWEWAETDESPSHIRTWIELYDGGKCIGGALQCHWFLANNAIDEKSDIYSTYMGAGWEKKKVTSAVNTNDVDLTNSLIVPLAELPLSSTRYAYYTLLNHIEFAKAEFIITNPLQGNKEYSLTLTDINAVDFINNPTIEATLQNAPSSEVGDISYIWEVKDVFKGTILTDQDYTINQNKITFNSGALASVLQIRVNVKAYWKEKQGLTQFLLAEETREYRNTSEINLYSLQLTNIEQVFYYSGGMREGAEPMNIEATLVKLNTETGVWEALAKDSWTLEANKTSQLGLIDEIYPDNDEKKCGFTIKDIYNASISNNQIEFNAIITDAAEVIVATVRTNFTFIQSGDPGTNGTDYVAQVYNTDDNKTINFIIPTVQPITYETTFYFCEPLKLSFDYDSTSQLVVQNMTLYYEITHGENGAINQTLTFPMKIYLYKAPTPITDFSSLDDNKKVYDASIDIGADTSSTTINFSTYFSLEDESNYQFIIIPDNNLWESSNSNLFISSIYIPSEVLSIPDNTSEIEINNIKISDIHYTNTTTVTEEVLGNYALKLTNIFNGTSFVLQDQDNINKIYIDDKILQIKGQKNNIDYYGYASLLSSSMSDFDISSGFNYILYGSNGKNARASLKPFKDSNGNILAGSDDTKGYLTYDNGYALTQKPLELDRYTIITVNEHEVPILLLKNRYEYASINGWDGSELKINENYILSPMAGFGQKESDNSFTGVVLGESSEKEKISTDEGETEVTCLGLMAYSEGKRTVFIDARTGAAYFKGEIVAGSGDIAGFKIESDKLWKTEGNKEVGLSTNDKTPWALWAGNSDGYGEGAPFRLDHSGNIYIEGKGVIAGFEITAEKLWKSNENKEVGLSVSGDYAFWAGVDKAFSVNHKGYLTADAGTIGGWTIVTPEHGGDGQFYNLHSHIEQEDGTVLGTGIQRPGSGTWSFAAGYTDYGNWATAPFRVNHQGVLYAKGGYFNDAHFSMSGDPKYVEDGITINNNIIFERAFSSAQIEGTISKNAIKVDEFGNFTIGGYAQYLTTSVTYNSAETYIKIAPQTSGILIAYRGSFEGIWDFGATVSATSTDSDYKLKSQIQIFPDNYSILFDNLRSVIYKYNNGTSDRFHTGFIAQDVKAAMDIAGLTTQDFAALTIENYDKPEKEQIWRLRYEEFIALNTDQIQKLKKRVAQLEEQLAEIKGETNDSN